MYQHGTRYMYIKGKCRCTPCCQSNRDYLKGWKKKHRAEFQSRVDVLKDNPCVDCGQKFPPECMDFDHLEDKWLNVAKIVSQGYSFDKVLEEITKCELVCANCHRIRTRTRRAVVTNLPS